VVTTCTYTFTYALPGQATDKAVIATASIHGHTRVIGRGRIRHHRLTLRVDHLQRGRYILTMLCRTGHKWAVIGDTSLTVT
jgi:hypothetical protein